MKISQQQLKQLIKEELNKELELKESIYNDVVQAQRQARSPEEQLAVVWVILKHMAKTLETALHTQKEMSKRMKEPGYDPDDPVDATLDQMGIEQ